MSFIPIDTDLIVLGGQTATARKVPDLMKKDVFGIGGFNEGWDKLYKSSLITEILRRTNNYTQDQIQCLESELLNEIQSPENIQAVQTVPQSTIAGGAGAEQEGINI